jgi:hypothetical protein
MYPLEIEFAPAGIPGDELFPPGKKLVVVPLGRTTDGELPLMDNRGVITRFIFFLFLWEKKLGSCCF